MILLLVWLIPALTFIAPTFKWMSSNNETFREDTAAFAVSVLISAGWPLWVALILRHKYLTRITGGATD